MTSSVDGLSSAKAALTPPAMRGQSAKRPVLAIAPSNITGVLNQRWYAMRKRLGCGVLLTQYHPSITVHACVVVGLTLRRFRSTYLKIRKAAGEKISKRIAVEAGHVTVQRHVSSCTQLHL